MAITINGTTNTITGIAVGGLPDGIVDTDMLAANAVNSAKLASDHLVPGTNNTYDLGTSSLRWRNIYTNDLNLSNEGGANDVDETWGSYTIQEGAEDLFLINRRNGKKYKFNLTEVS